MKKSKIIYVKISAIIFAVALILSVTALAIPNKFASANSAPLYWDGVASAGAIVTDENCPIEVESEVLTFDIQTFPEFYYYEQEEFDGYGAKVTAHYDFYNPADYDVEMTLVFPFGNFPPYVDWQIDDSDKYSVTADGEEVEGAVRHTFSRGAFDAETDIPKIADGFKEDGVFSPDTPVHGYLYRVSGITARDTYLKFTSAYDRTRTAVFAAVTDGYSQSYVSICSIHESANIAWVKNGYYVYIFVVGEETEPKFSFMTEGVFSDKPANGDLYLEKEEEMTFEELVMAYRSENSEVSETDWYNAMLGYIGEYGCIDSFLYNYLMRWCEYRLTIPAGGRLVNEVTVPLYPEIIGNYAPDIFGYEYLLSPAKGWASFGSLEIVINTPYYVISNSLGNFEKTEDGYILSLEGLPDGELTFNLCAEENPTRVKSWMRLGGAIGVFFCVICFGALIILEIIVPLIILIVFAVTGQLKGKPKQ